MRRFGACVVCVLGLSSVEARAYVPRTTADGELVRWWSGQELTFQLATVEPEEIDAAELPELLATIFDQWIDLPCGLVPEVAYAGLADTTTATDPNDGPDNVVLFVREKSAWAALGRPSSELAITLVAFDPDTGEIVDADILVNDAHHVFTLADSPAQGEVSFQAVLLHEIGHLYGLDHSLEPGAVMAASYNGDRTTLTVDDADGACFLYTDVPPHEEPTVTTNTDDDGCASGGAGLVSLGLGLLPLLSRLTGLRRRARRVPHFEAASGAKARLAGQ